MAGSLIMKRVTESQVIKGSLTGTYTAATDALNSTPSQTFTASTLTARQAVGDTTQGAALAAGVLTIQSGFVPKYVRAVNVTDRIMWEWYSGMLNGDYIETVAAGTRTLETDDKITVSVTTGVVVITLSDLSVGDNDTLAWHIEA